MAVSQSDTPSKADAMSSILTTQLEPSHLEIEDVSGGCGAFFRVLIVSDKFTGKSTLARHRLVQGFLKEDIQNMHGLTLVTMTPTQYEQSTATAAATE
jgi:stress-induced morphogen